jgi:hypothetical protein
MRLGGVTLDLLFGPMCALPEWDTKAVHGDAYCTDPDGCPYKHVGCHSATVASPWAVSEFVAWADDKLNPEPKQTVDEMMREKI